MVVNVVDTVTGFSFHKLIIPACSSYVNTFFKNYGRGTRRREIALRATPLSSHPTREWVFRGVSYKGVAAGTTQVTATLNDYGGFTGSQSFTITVE